MKDASADPEWESHVIWASGHYMSNPYPPNFQEMSKDAFEEFVEDNVWKPFEYLPITELMELVEDLAISAIKHFNQEDLEHE